MHAIPPVAGGYVVEFLAHNRGNRTAASVMVEGALRSAAGGVETSEATIDIP